MSGNAGTLTARYPDDGLAVVTIAIDEVDGADRAMEDRCGHYSYVVVVGFRGSVENLQSTNGR
jgi:hypothetical protein